jgi:hypothetical protein
MARKHTRNHKKCRSGDSKRPQQWDGCCHGLARSNHTKRHSTSLQKLVMQPSYSVAAPGRRTVGYLAPNERERTKRALIHLRLEYGSGRAFDGSLKTIDLMRVIAGARFYPGGDSCALHLAGMAGTPTVSQVPAYDGMRDWMPKGKEQTIGQAGDNGVLQVPAESLSQGFTRLTL